MLTHDMRRERRAIFEACPTIDGFDVIEARTGRPMGFQRDTRREANGIAQSLNNAAMRGPQQLARALRCA